MEAKTATPLADKEYLDFEPSMEWAWEDKQGTVLLFLPGFNKQQLRVQVTSSGMLRLSGERPLGGQRWNRFFKEVQIPKNCNSNAITARFEDNILYVQFPNITEQQVAPVNPVPQSQPQPPPPEHPQRPPSQENLPMEPAKQPQKKAANEPPSGKPPPPQIPTNEQKSEGGEPKKETQAPKQKSADEANSSTPGQKENPKTHPADEKALVKEGDELGVPSKKIRGREVGDATEVVTKLKQEANLVARGSAKSTLEGYTKVVGSMARDLRRGGKLFNLIVIVLLALLLGLYFGKMTKSSEKLNI